MTNNDLAKKSEVSRSLLITYGIDPDSVLPSVGYTSVSEISQAYQDKSLSLGANYHAGTWSFLANAPEKRIDRLLRATPWLIAGLGIILAVAQGSKLYALAAFSALLVYFLAKERAEVGNAIMGIGLMAAAGVAFNSHWVWAGIILALVVSSFCGRARRMWYSEIIVARALLDDSVFAMLFATDKVNVRDNSTGKRIYYTASKPRYL